MDLLTHIRGVYDFMTYHQNGVGVYDPIFVTSLVNNDIRYALV